MDFNDIFYKPKRESEFSVKYNRRRRLAFLASIALIFSLSADTSGVDLKRKAFKDNIEELKILSNALLLHDSYSKLINEDRNLEHEMAAESLYMLENPEIEASTELVKKEITLIEGPAEFARYIRNLLKDVPSEVKYNYILEHFKHTPFEVDVMQAVICKEAKPTGETGNRYEDAFSVINSVYNRLRSITKCGFVRSWTGKEGSITMYDHIIAPGQYQPYGDGTYKIYLGHTTSCTDEAYQAFLDFLYIADKGYGYMTDKMDFMASGQGYSDSEIYVQGGNEFRNPLTKNDTIPLEGRYYMVNEEVITEESEISDEVVVDRIPEIIDETEKDITVKIIDGDTDPSVINTEPNADLVSESFSPIIIIGEEYFDDSYNDENTLTLQR